MLTVADARDLGIDICPGMVLETKHVGEFADGSRQEWRLVVQDDFTDKWAPVIVQKNGKEFEPVWAALPGSQNLFLQCPIFEALYEGNRGPGKTLTLIMDFAKDCNRGFGKAWRGVLFRRAFGDLDDVVRKIEDWFPKMFPGFRFLKSKSEYMAIWESGETLLLRHMRDENDYSEYHGHEYPWIGWEELTQWENDKAYKLMMSCCRPTRPGVPCRIRATTNPYGVGHNWVKRRFQLPQMRGHVIRVEDEVPRVAIHGALHENFLLLHAAPTYRTQIKQAARNPAEAAAWLDGSWDVTAGGMIDDIWKPEVHVIPTFPARMIPRGWTLVRAYDHGQSHPFAAGWWLESNGEPIEFQGRLIGRVRGDLILWAEWYGTTGNENEGIRMPARKIGQGIRDRETDWGVYQRVIPGPADTEIYNKSSDRNGRCPADDMEDVGVYFERADKSPGSRKRGWEMMRTRLEDAYPNQDGTRERPGLFICDRCKYWLTYVPPMPRAQDDPDDIPAKYEDHLCDMTRYRLNWEVPVMWRKSGF